MQHPPTRIDPNSRSSQYKNVYSPLITSLSFYESPIRCYRRKGIIENLVDNQNLSEKHSYFRGNLSIKPILNHDNVVRTSVLETFFSEISLEVTEFTKQNVN